MQIQQTEQKQQTSKIERNNAKINTHQKWGWWKDWHRQHDSRNGIFQSAQKNSRTSNTQRVTIIIYWEASRFEQWKTL